MTREEMRKRYEGKKPVGVLSLNNFGGLEILDIIGGDHVVDCFNYGENRVSYGMHKVQYTSSGRPFIKKFGVRYYLDTVMKVS